MWLALGVVIDPPVTLFEFHIRSGGHHDLTECFVRVIKLHEPAAESR